MPGRDGNRVRRRRCWRHGRRRWWRDFVARHADIGGRRRQRGRFSARLRIRGDDPWDSGDGGRSPCRKRIRHVARRGTARGHVSRRRGLSGRFRHSDPGRRPCVAGFGRRRVCSDAGSYRGCHGFSNSRRRGLSHRLRHSVPGRRPCMGGFGRRRDCSDVGVCWGSHGFGDRHHVRHVRS